jgi:hypothetical protein
VPYIYLSLAGYLWLSITIPNILASLNSQTHSRIVSRPAGPGPPWKFTEEPELS